MVELDGVRDDGRLPIGVWVTALAFVAVHLLPRPGYEFNRDSLLYLAMGDHLELFRMQFPPMIAILAELARALPLPILASVNLLSALAGAALTLVAAMICRDLGGSRRAQVFAAVAVLASPTFLRGGTLFQPVVFERLFWGLAIIALVKLLTGANRRWWMLAGLGLGLGALTKFSVAFLGVGVVVAVLGSPLRQDLRGRWPWIGMAIAAVLALPSITGQMAHGWPFLTQAAALSANQLERVSRLDFITGQFLALGPGALLWLIGLGALLFSPRFRRFRALGLMAGGILLVFLLTGGKPYYFDPVHPLLLAAASAYIAATIVRPVPRVVFASALAAYLLAGAALLPIGVPLLPPAEMARYAEAIGATSATETNYGTRLPLPQDYADMTGWREMVDSVAVVYHSLPEQEQASATIFGINYGRTGALAVYGPGLGLPYPVSRHGDFFAWGFGNLGQGTTIVVGGSRGGLDAIFEEVTEATVVRNRWGVDEEQEVSIWVCRRPRADLKELVQREGVIWG